MSTMSDEKSSGAVSVRRMSGVERREQILDAATPEFARGGYAGTTTDQVARAAGVSQPYVVRLFGTKERLFQAVFDRVSGLIVERFEAVPASADAKHLMVDAYLELISNPDQLRVLLHGYAAGSDPAIGARAREVMVRAFELFRERTGGSVEDARDFVARGMLLNVILGVEALEHMTEDDSLSVLVNSVLHPAH